MNENWYSFTVLLFFFLKMVYFTFWKVQFNLRY